jgi:cysteine-rich repeat protein
VLRGDLEVGAGGYEACDDGNQSDSDGCTSGCLEARCGDGYIRVGVEDCDDRNPADDDACTNSCRFAACGDGVRRTDLADDHDDYEDCDDGNRDDRDGCRSNCISAACGDGILRNDIQEGQPGYEGCDDGNIIATDGCTQLCLVARCGDGVLRQGLESCDDGNEVNTDACLNSCTVARCGDGVARSDLEVGQQDYEACDDGNLNQRDACLNHCQSARCGDGYVRSDVAEDDEAFEECDEEQNCQDCRRPAQADAGPQDAGMQGQDTGVFQRPDGYSEGPPEGGLPDLGFAEAGPSDAGPPPDIENLVRDAGEARDFGYLFEAGNTDAYQVYGDVAPPGWDGPIQYFDAGPRPDAFQPDNPVIPDVNAPEVNVAMDIGNTQTSICDLWMSGMFQSCVNCHGAAGGVAINHATPRTLHDSFVNVAGNSNLDLVSPRNPQGSYLYAKMLGMQAFVPGGGGGRMPQGGPYYSQEDLAPLLRWINSDNLAACLP